MTSTVVVVLVCSNYEFHSVSMTVNQNDVNTPDLGQI